MKKSINLFALFVLVSVNVFTPVSYAQIGELLETTKPEATEISAEKKQSLEDVETSNGFEEPAKLQSQSAIDIVSEAMDELKEVVTQELENKVDDTKSPEENKFEEVWEEAVGLESDDLLSPMQLEDNILDTEDSIPTLEDDEIDWIIDEIWIITISDGEDEILIRNKNVWANDSAVALLKIKNLLDDNQDSVNNECEGNHDCMNAKYLDIINVKFWTNFENLYALQSKLIKDSLESVLNDKEKEVLDLMLYQMLLSDQCQVDDNNSGPEIGGFYNVDNECITSGLLSYMNEKYWAWVPFESIDAAEAYFMGKVWEETLDKMFRINPLEFALIQSYWKYYFRWNNNWVDFNEMEIGDNYIQNVTELIWKWFDWWNSWEDNTWWEELQNNNPCTGDGEYLPTPEDWINLMRIWASKNHEDLLEPGNVWWGMWPLAVNEAWWLRFDDADVIKQFQEDILIPAAGGIELNDCSELQIGDDDQCDATMSFRWRISALWMAQDVNGYVWSFYWEGITYDAQNVMMEDRWLNYRAMPVRCFVRANPVTVTYVLWENEEIKQTLEAWKTISSMYYPEKDGYYFLGWYQDSSYSWWAFDFSTPIEENITLYAKRVHIIYNDEDITYTDTKWNVFEWMGTITFTDGIKSIIMLDRNLWATVRLGDSEWNSDGYYFQWGNNYGFLPWENEVDIEQVDVTWYGRNNPYVRDVFVANSKSWIDTSEETEYADNLWWWLDDYRDNTWDSSIWHDYMRQWPCPEWYHVPSGWEWLELVSLWSDNKPSNDVLAINIQNYPTYADFASGLLLPKAGKMNYEWYSVWGDEGAEPASVNELTVSNRKKNIYLWTSSPYYRFSWSESALYWSRRLFIAKWAKAQSSVERAYGFPVRCFKDNYIGWDEPLILSYDTRWGSAIQAQTIPEWENGYLPGYTTHRTWYTLLWWYDNLGELELDENKITNRTMKNDLSENGVVTIYARWNDDHVVTFKDHDGSVIKVVLVRNWENVQSPVNPTREGYKFTGWDKDLNNVTEDMEVTAQYSSSSNGWYSWWGGLVSKPDKSHNSVDDKEISDTKDSQQKDVRQESQWKSLDTSSPYKETLNAHKWAYQQWLTKYENISEARMDERLNRSEMAKISSIFATQMLNKVPNEEKREFCSQYPDLWKVEDDMKLFIIESCELWYMWYESNWIDALARFRPYTPVTVAEAATILSRIVRWNDNAMNGKDWYKWHLYATYNHGLLDDIIDPTTRNITRREAYTMLYRLIKNS